MFLSFLVVLASIGVGFLLGRIASEEVAVARSYLKYGSLVMGLISSVALFLSFIFIGQSLFSLYLFLLLASVYYYLSHYWPKQKGEILLIHLFTFVVLLGALLFVQFQGTEFMLLSDDPFLVGQSLLLIYGLFIGLLLYGRRLHHEP